MNFPEGEGGKILTAEKEKRDAVWSAMAKKYVGTA
jgi:hypothetical protein